MSLFDWLLVVLLVLGTAAWMWFGVKLHYEYRIRRLEIEVEWMRTRLSTVRETAARLGIKTSDHQDDFDLETGKGGGEHE